MAGKHNPYYERTYLWDATQTTYAGAPVVMSSSTDEMVTVPAGTSADVIFGIASEDAGPAAFASAVNEKVVAVQWAGNAQMYAKGAITRGQRVKVGPTITITPAGYTQPITINTAQAATQATAGSQPYPILGVATNSTSQDGDIIYVWLQQGAMY